MQRDDAEDEDDGQRHHDDRVDLQPGGLVRVEPWKHAYVSKLTSQPNTAASSPFLQILLVLETCALSVVPFIAVADSASNLLLSTVTRG